MTPHIPEMKASRSYHSCPFRLVSFYAVPERRIICH
jgi:hypothetical protein